MGIESSACRLQCRGTFPQVILYPLSAPFFGTIRHAGTSARRRESREEAAAKGSRAFLTRVLGRSDGRDRSEREEVLE